MKKTIKIIFALIAFIFCLEFVFLFGLSHIEIQNEVHLVFTPPSEFHHDRDISITKTEHIESFSFEHNLTHLWSWQLADQNYFRLARNIPCRNITYERGPADSNMDTCDYSSTNEFSLPNSIQAQKWLYDHQHPTDCSNKRIAIIQNFASSGFGSTVHQLAWAFSTALADDRIAIYRTPGNWVS
jgi:hypothetical protein